VNTASKTDWKRLDELENEDIDTRDLPELDEEFFARAELYIPPKQAVATPC
jgi:hypothetical protein